MESKVALITGITGQDGSYLAEFLLKKGYEVYGTIRRHSTPNTYRIDHLLDKIHLIDADIIDMSSLDNAVNLSHPDEIYNLAAQSFVGISWSQPVITSDITGIGVVKLLESVRKYTPNARFYQASSSEMFGKVSEYTQNENTQFHPRSPYGIAKLFGYWSSVNYRESYKMHISNGILFNHESPRRGLEFVTRKISRTTADIYHGLESKLRLGNVDAIRDWGFAGDYVDAMWRMLQKEEPSDYVIATCKTHSVLDFVNIAFNIAGLDVEEHLEIDEKLMRPADVLTLKGNYSKAKKELGWSPTVTFEDLVEMMVKNDIAQVY